MNTSANSKNTINKSNVHSKNNGNRRAGATPSSRTMSKKAKKMLRELDNMNVEPMPAEMLNANGRGFLQKVCDDQLPRMRGVDAHQ